MHKLSSSVLTSSLDLPLAKIIHSVSNTNVTKCFELFVAREIDLFEAKVEYEMDSKLSSIIAGNESELSDWYSETMQDRDVSAVATYLPGITSLDTTVRMESASALQASINIANRLQDSPIVESVCGTIVDRREDGEIQKTGRRKKLLILVKSLCEAIEGSDASEPTIALELEPGDLYVLNGQSALDDLIGLLDLNVDLTKSFGMDFDDDQEAVAILNWIAERKPTLDKIGINIDISHFIMSGIQAEYLQNPRVFSRIANAHISDHPGFHTHDQLIGKWTNLVGDKSYLSYLETIAKCASRESGKIRFSNAVSVELEGNSREMLMLDCLSRLNYLLSEIK